MKRLLRSLRWRVRAFGLARLRVKPCARVPLAVCAIIKNEADYLREWLEFHRLQGVERFYLYDNNSSDGTGELLAPYVERGIVALCEWPLYPGQLEAYNHCVRWRRAECDWLAFLDIDEFLFSVDGAPLPVALRAYEAHVGVSVHWLMFSTSGHVSKPRGLTIENYTRCQVGGNRHVKLVARPQRIERVVSSHSAKFFGGALPVNERFEPFAGALGTPSVSRLRVNHYWTRSREEFLERRMARGPVDAVSRLRDLEGLELAESAYNTGCDDAILQFVPALQERLKSNLA